MNHQDSLTMIIDWHYLYSYLDCCNHGNLLELSVGHDAMTWQVGASQLDRTAFDFQDRRPWLQEFSTAPRGLSQEQRAVLRKEELVHVRKWRESWYSSRIGYTHKIHFWIYEHLWKNSWPQCHGHVFKSLSCYYCTFNWSWTKLESPNLLAQTYR